MDSVVHFEMPFDDRERMARFYQSAFGWQTIGVDDIQASMRKVTEAGGQVLGEPMEIAGVGQDVAFLDTEGNRVSLLQPIRQA